jgi:hypothetical protein
MANMLQFFSKENCCAIGFFTTIFWIIIDKYLIIKFRSDEEFRQHEENKRADLLFSGTVSLRIEHDKCLQRAERAERDACALRAENTKLTERAKRAENAERNLRNEIILLISYEENTTAELTKRAERAERSHIALRDVNIKVIERAKHAEHDLHALRAQRVEGSKYAKRVSDRVNQLIQRAKKSGRNLSLEEAKRISEEEEESFMESYKGFIDGSDFFQDTH